MRVVDCTYKDERYSVRDNGEVLRHSPVSKRLRQNDNEWTLGKLNKKIGYFVLASARVHRIVAIAFNGEPPTKEHVVDHIDTNRQNNRPENLRWVTRLENVMLNPITARRIEIVCGCSIEEFLADPSKYRDKFPEPNYKWMGAVSKQEGQSSLERMLAWAKSDKLPSGGSLGEWIRNRATRQNQNIESVPDVPESIESKTLNAVQRNWKVPTEYLCCPQEYADEPIKTYAEKLKEGSVFCRNNVYSSLILKSTISNDHQSIYVITESTEGKSAIKPWALAKITYENGQFVHESLRTFFEQIGAEKQFCIALGLEWLGGDSIDDNC